MAKLAAGKTGSTAVAPSSDDTAAQRDAARERARQKSAARTAAKQQQAAERIATATQELSSGTAEAAEAVKQLMGAMESIASGAEECAKSAQGGVEAAKGVAEGTEVVSSTTGTLVTKIDAIQALVQTTGDELGELTQGVATAAQANMESAKLVGDLEQQSNEIGNIVEAVVRIADQTNLLALNAAIEAARAGQHGKGFAVVADEVRNLAETSEKSAREIRELVEKIQTDVRQVAKDIQSSSEAANEGAKKAEEITGDLDKIISDSAKMQKACVEVNQQAGQAASACEEYLKAGDNVASAAEENSAAAEEASKSTQEQSRALQEMDSGVQDLAEMAESLKDSTSGDKSSQQLAAAAEELSAVVQECNSSAQQIMSAIEQIAKGADQAASAAEQGGAACEQTERIAKLVVEAADESQEKVTALTASLTENKQGVDDMIAGVGRSAEEATQSANAINLLGERTRQIDKIIDAIVNVTIQTNLLAVNGSIEAARAGEYGRGFAVVAADVRNLAGESSENADKAKDLVRNIQQQITAVASDIEGAGRTASSQVQKARKTTAVFETIMKDMQEVEVGIREVKEAAVKAASGTEEAGKAAQQIAEAAEASRTATAEAGAAAQQGAKGMQELASAIEEVSSLADELQN